MPIVNYQGQSKHPILANKQQKIQQQMQFKQTLANQMQYKNPNFLNNSG